MVAPRRQVAAKGRRQAAGQGRHRVQVSTPLCQCCCTSFTLLRPAPFSPDTFHQPSLSAVLSLKILPDRVLNIMTFAHICPKVRGVDALKAFSLNLVKPYIAPAPRQVGYAAGLAFSCQLCLLRTCC